MKPVIAKFLPLKQFFSAYFNQNWDYFAEDADTVVKEFCIGNPVEENSALASWIEKVPPNSRMMRNWRISFLRSSDATTNRLVSVSLAIAGLSL